jgi:motility quorum-sensing regulator / GCU-specific mRNA interferase toxin
MVYFLMANRRKPAHDLAAIKNKFRSVQALHVTGTALRTAFELGFGRQDIVDVIQSIERRHFFKSMTSYTDQRVWQDVYYVPYDEISLYVKFTSDAVTEFKLLSFKENSND